MSRKAGLLGVTKKLVLLAGITLLTITIIIGLTFIFSQKLMVSWLCMFCGILGGFVSIQQRLKKISDEELQILSESWFQILLIPIYGGIFSLLLYILFISEIISGQFFPSFNFPDVPKTGVDSEYFKSFFTDTYPSSGKELAKLLFWTFIAGFSERFVPQIITDISKKTDLSIK